MHGVVSSPKVMWVVYPCRSLNPAPSHGSPRVNCWFESGLLWMARLTQLKTAGITDQRLTSVPARSTTVLSSQLVLHRVKRTAIRPEDCNVPPPHDDPPQGQDTYLLKAGSISAPGWPCPSGGRRAPGQARRASPTTGFRVGSALPWQASRSALLIGGVSVGV